MVGRFKQALLEKGKMPKKFSVKSGDKSAEGGLTAKGVKRYRAANPGSKLKTAVTTKPSKLKKGSKSAKRRKSFCARMGGMKKRMTSAKTRRDPNSRINKALRKWNCSTDANPNALQQIAERVVEAVLKQEPTFRDRVRQRMARDGDSRIAAVSKQKMAQDEERIKAAQGKNTMSSVFGKAGTQDSATAYGGDAGSAEERTPPMTRKQVNMAGTASAKPVDPKKQGAANIKLMKDLGVLRFDDKGRRIRSR